MEWWDYKKLPWLSSFMEGKGYLVVTNQMGDIIFVKKDSEMAEIVDRKKLWTAFILFQSIENTTKKRKTNWLTLEFKIKQFKLFKLLFETLFTVKNLIFELRSVFVFKKLFERHLNKDSKVLFLSNKQKHNLMRF